MSELKEWTASEIEEYDDARLELAEDGKIDCTRVYIKEDVNKVIAELKESVKGLILDNYLKDKELRHNKYKRCLDKSAYWVAVSYQCVDNKHRQQAERHHKKWLELAEKFKEGVKCRG